MNNQRQSTLSVSTVLLITIDHICINVTLESVIIKLINFALMILAIVNYILHCLMLTYNKLL